PSNLAKRATESVHLANCPGSPEYSLVVYCDKDSDCFGTNPGDNNICVVTKGSYKKWETQGSCTFPTGVTFRYNVQSGANNFPAFSYVGTGSNDFKQFTGYRDNNPGFIKYNGQTCISLYYFL
ncbi:hypothetical protein GQ53DRAFT_605190, partial [Thozetella sp. PMI_491]